MNVDMMVDKIQLLWLQIFVVGAIAFALLLKFSSRLSIQWRKFLVRLLALTWIEALLLLFGDGIYALIYGIVHMRFVFVSVGVIAVVSTVPLSLAAFLGIGIVEAKIAKLPMFEVIPDEDDADAKSDMYTVLMNPHE